MKESSSEKNLAIQAIVGVIIALALAIAYAVSLAEYKSQEEKARVYFQTKEAVQQEIYEMEEKRKATATAVNAGNWDPSLSVSEKTEVNAYSLTNFPSNGLKIATLAMEKGSVIRIAVSDNSFSAISRGKFYPGNCKNGCILLLPNDNDLFFVEGIHTGEFKPSMYKDLTFIRGAEVLKVDN